MGNEMGNMKSEMILRLALAEQMEQDPEILAFLPESEQEVRHVFTAGHEKKMKKIFRTAKRAEQRPVQRKRMVRAAAGIAVFLGISVVTISSVDAFRIPVISFITDVREKATQYRITKNMDGPFTKSFAEFEPTYVPEGFYVNSFSETSDSYTIIYFNEEGNLWYELHYYTAPVTISFDTEKAYSSETEINGNKTIIVEENGEYRATMYRNTSQVILNGTISRSELEKVLESIK